jgi:hypothetical protein
MVHGPIEYPHLAMVIAKAIASLSLPYGFLVEVVIHFDILFHHFHDARHYFVFVHFVRKVHWSRVVGDVSRFALKTAVGAA